ncbi:MAG: 1-acyl-sn-glycerol-3-phosphate acyltransferase [Bacteroidota bacterium]|nr:1-acyl-sn-glycerol-3-phosphate acyltransferase [Bacteroidota bacterium]
MQDNRNDQNSGEKLIDVEKVFQAKSPRLARKIPLFIYNYLKRVVHQDDINEAIRRFGKLQGLDFVHAILDYMGVNITHEGIENIPVEGRFIIASNHPLGGLDGMALMQEVGKVRRDIVFPVNDLIMNIPNLLPLFIPINKHGSNSQNITIMNETFASDKAILYFPAGLCSRKQHGKILDLEWKKTFVSKARTYQRDIIPVHINGRNSDWFYNLANWRKRLGIKANIEMLYLVDEMYKQNNKNINIIFGKPIPWTIFDNRYPDLVWAQKVKKHVYNLENNISAILDVNQ